MDGGKLKLAELNPHLICVLCGGYLIDATSIVECLHSFCRTCIIHYLNTSNYCPICEVLVHKKRPLEHIRSDTILQDIVYKTVPGLFKEEMKRRREFYDKLKKKDGDKTEYIPAEGKRLVFSPDEMISLCLKFSSPTSNGQSPDNQNDFEDSRYLLCPAGVSMMHLKKFVRLKFNVSDHYMVDLFCKDELLYDYFTLVDVAYLSEWKRDTVLQINYAFYGNPAKRHRLSETTELPVASDDVCSNGCVSSVTNIASDDECFEDSGCEVNDSQISHDESALSDIVDQQENCYGIDLSMKTLRRNSLEKGLSSNEIPDKLQTSKIHDTSSKSYMTSYVTFLDQRVTSAHAPMKLPLRSPTATSTQSSVNIDCDLNDSGHVEGNNINSNQNSPSIQNNNYVILPNDTSVQDKPLTLKIRKPSCDFETQKSDCPDTDSAGDRHGRCVGICNGHTVKSKSDKLLLRLSRDGDSNTYTASMS